MGIFDFLKNDSKSRKTSDSSAASRRAAVAKRRKEQAAKGAAAKAKRAKELEARKKARAAKTTAKTTATPKPKATAKKQSQYANLDKGTKDAAGLTKGQKASTRKAVAVSKSTGTVKTKGGDYKTFAKGSKASGNFREAFALAKKKGGKTFTWNGKKYSTKTK